MGHFWGRGTLGALSGKGTFGALLGRFGGTFGAWALSGYPQVNFGVGAPKGSLGAFSGHGRGQFGGVFGACSTVRQGTMGAVKGHKRGSLGA